MSSPFPRPVTASRAYLYIYNQFQFRVTFWTSVQHSHDISPVNRSAQPRCIGLRPRNSPLQNPRERISDAKNTRGNNYVRRDTNIYVVVNRISQQCHDRVTNRDTDDNMPISHSYSIEYDKFAHSGGT